MSTQNCVFQKKYSIQQILINFCVGGHSTDSIYMYLFRSVPKILHFYHSIFLCPFICWSLLSISRFPFRVFLPLPLCFFSLCASPSPQSMELGWERVPTYLNFVVSCNLLGAYYRNCNETIQLLSGVWNCWPWSCSKHNLKTIKNRKEWKRYTIYVRT